MPIFWNQEPFRWNSPQAIWNGGGASQATHKKSKHMSSIVLNIKDLDELEIEARLRALALAQTNNPTAATGLTTSPAMLTAAADDIRDKRAAKAVADAAAEAATANKNTAVGAGEELIRDYAPEVWKGTGKDPVKCTLLGFDVSDGSTPPPPPGDGQITGVELSAGPNAGELVVKSDAKPPRTLSIEVQVNRTPNAAPSWEHEEIISSTPSTLDNLPPGSLVQVRLRAVFAGKVKGPWSDIAEHRVP